jgi:hypothetical protein
MIFLDVFPPFLLDDESLAPATVPRLTHYLQDVLGLVLNLGPTSNIASIPKFVAGPTYNTNRRLLNEPPSVVSVNPWRFEPSLTKT